MKQPAPRDHLEAEAGADAAAVTDRGRRHKRNEDAFALCLTGDVDGHRTAPGVIAVVCDGVSTTVDPDLASQAAADAAAVALLGGADLDAAHAAAQAAALAIASDPPPPGLGWPSCTFLAGFVEGTTVSLATMGDCRTFWLPVEGDPATLTTDDSWAAERLAAGDVTREEAYAGPYGHTITRWLGRDADPAWRPRRTQFQATGPGRLVLCSDGLWNYADSAQEVAGVAGAGSPLEVARRLVDFANESGGHDNITVIVVDVKGQPA